MLRLTKSTGKAKLSLAVGGLDPSTQHTVFGSEAACGTPHSQTDLEFLHFGVSDPEGDLIDTALINTEDPYGLRSVRIVEGTGTGGPRVTCVEGYFVEIGGSEVWIE